MSGRPEPIYVHRPDTRKKCENCNGSGRVKAVLCIPDNDDGTNTCHMCNGMGLTGHYAATSTTLPHPSEWQKYADSLESNNAELNIKYEALEKKVAELTTPQQFPEVWAKYCELEGMDPDTASGISEIGASFIYTAGFVEGGAKYEALRVAAQEFAYNGHAVDCKINRPAIKVCNCGLDALSTLLAQGGE